MKRAAALFLTALVVFSLASTTGLVSARYGTKIIDGTFNDWTNADLVATGRDNEQAGANLEGLYVAWDEEYLYIYLKTNNTQSWDVAYGIGIDVDPGTGKGYVSGGDSWGRNIEFSNGFAVDYEIYFWWSWNGGMGTDNFNTWTGSGWSYSSISGVGGSLAYTGDTSTGLHSIEIKIPWSALGGKPERIAIMAWVTGSSGSAVDSLPVDPAIDYSDIGAEWGDTDTFSNLAVIYVGAKKIDGNLSDWSDNEVVAVDVNGTGVPGGNLTKLYVSWDGNYLYLAIETNNTANWGMAYGFGIDVDPGSGNGYTTGTDAWGRSIEFSNGFAVDYEIYFWWDDGSASITTAQLNPYENGWSWPSLTSVGGKYNYTGDSSTGLKTLEVAIPWSAIGGMPKDLAVSAWVTGGGGSAVDVLPQESIASDSDNEWGDTDVITKMAELEVFIPSPELTVKLSGPTVVGANRTTTYNVTVTNLGSVPVTNVSVNVYANDSLLVKRTLNLGAGESRWFTFTWKPNVTGTYVLRAIVDENNTIEEVNEGNNEFDLTVSVIWVGRIEVDGNPNDWPSVELSDNSYTVVNGTFIWKDAENDQRTDKDEYLSETGYSSSHADLTEVAVTKDGRYVYFLFRFRNMSNVKLGSNGATFIAVPIDYKAGGADWFAGQMDTKSAINWDIQMAINLKCSGCSGTEATSPAGDSVESMLYFLDPSGNVVKVDGAIVGVNLKESTVEVRVPVGILGGNTTFSFEVATGLSYGEAVWNFGEPFSNDGISDAVDVMSDKPTGREVADDYVDYYVQLKINGMVESAKGIDHAEQREAIQFQEFLNEFILLNKYYGLKRFQKEYAHYIELDSYLRNITLPEDFKRKLEKYEHRVTELVEIYKEGKENIDNGYAALGASLKISHAYRGLREIILEMDAMKRTVETGNLERIQYMRELAKNLTKTIDGNLDDWNVQPVAIDDTGYGQDGANLKALYVDYDEQFLYIAVTTENKASWRVAYGIALDYKNGGYTTGTDAWGRKISFNRGIDAELYFFWNGEFFGDRGTSNITSAQLILWNNTSWKYEDLKWVGFYAYTGGAENGLQTLEIAIPWKALGGRPEKINVVAFVTGQGAGDSAVDSLPLQEAVKDKAPSKEWGDTDTFAQFATVTIG